MFAALVNGWIDTYDIQYDVRLHDVETLNEMADQSLYDVTKMSFHKSLYLLDAYTLLQTGAALGHGCGPLLIARKPISESAIEKSSIALPGEWTTAHLLFKTFYPQTNRKTFLPFHEIEDAVLQGQADAGVIIHENRFTYQEKGLYKISDLGEKWETHTGLPIPLGGIFAAHRLSSDTIARVEKSIGDSIRFAFNHPDKVMPYVRIHAQEMDENVMRQHIDLYVNAFSLDLGPLGRQAVDFLKKSFTE